MVVVQAKVTVGAKPWGVVVKVPWKLPALFVTVTEAGSDVTEKSPPVPLNVVVCMAPPAAAVSVPLSAPVVVGVKVTLIVQFAPAASPLAPPQLSVSPKLVLAVIVNTCMEAEVLVSVTG
jgi:hypothetical protein